jgi:hypothetical protein
VVDKMMPATWDTAVTPPIGAGRGNYPAGVSPSPVAAPSDRPADAVRAAIAAEATGKPIAAGTSRPTLSDDARALLGLGETRASKLAGKKDEVNMALDYKAMENRAADPVAAFEAAKRQGVSGFELTPQEVAAVSRRSKAMEREGRVADMQSSTAAMIDAVQPDIDKLDEFVGSNWAYASATDEAKIKKEYAAIIRKAELAGATPDDIEAIKRHARDTLIAQAENTGDIGPMKNEKLINMVDRATRSR